MTTATVLRFKRTTDLNSVVTNELTLIDGRLAAEHVTIEGPPELVDYKPSSLGREIYRPEARPRRAIWLAKARNP